MTDIQWQAFCSFKKDFIEKIEEWNKRCPELQALQKAAAIAAGTPEYSFETPIVYNRDLDRFTKEDDIKLIVIGDNPGKDEQLLKNNKYLVGQAGKIADGFFKRNPELGVDFRKNVIILNKTPVHSAKTNQLKHMIKNGGAQVADLLQESQLWMAERTASLHGALCAGAATSCGTEPAVAGAEGSAGVAPELWLVGYAELKGKGIFIPYKEQLKATYAAQSSGAWDKVYVFQHFSMNRFTIDLGELTESQSWGTDPLLTRIHKAGILHKNEIFS